MRGRDGPCGRGQDHPERGPALHRGTAAPPGPGGPRGRLSGHRPAGAGAGHHHLLQAGPAAPGGGERTDPDGHPRPRGLLRRDGAHPSGAGLRRAGHQRHRRGPGPHPHPVAAAGALSPARVPVCEQDGPGGGGQSRRAGKPAGEPGQPVHRLYRRPERPG